MQNKLLIYLADLDHFVKGNRISTPLGIASIASHCKNILGDAIDIKLFKNPEELMQKLRERPPHVLGLSFYMWNVNLTLKMMEYCKYISCSTLTVIGGPSVARTSNCFKTLLNHNPSLDVVVLDQGEKSFVNILNKILSKGFDRKSFFTEGIPGGCAIRLNNTHSIERGDIVYDIQGLNKIPSPYLMGYLDSFLEAGFLPSFETTRGCPYQCTFCGGGDKLFSKLIVRDEDIVYEELLYLLKHSKSRELDLLDTNFGIMGERDLRISSFMLGLYKKHNFPYIAGFATSKGKTKTSIEVMKNMASLSGEFYFGLQTLTKQVLNNCKRKNIPIDTIKELVSISREINLPTYVDLIFGLPGETVQSFMETVSELASLGIEKSIIYQLRLLPSTEIAEKEREKYQYSIKFRPLNNRYGEYDLVPGEKPIRIIEVEEIACQSSTFNYKDYLTIREYGFTTELLVGYGAFTETISYLASRGIYITEVIKIIQQKSNQYPILSTLFNDYKVYSERELFKTEEDLIKNISKDDEQWKDLLLNTGNYFKVNLGFVGYCLFESAETLDNTEQIIRRYVRGKLPLEEIENLNAVFREDKLHRIIQNKREGRLRLSDIKKEISVKEQFDYKKWKVSSFQGKLSEHKLNAPTQNIYYIEKYEDLMQKIGEYSILSGYHFYERILLHAPRISLKRRCKVIEQIF